jgi:hypothetical protein
MRKNRWWSAAGLAGVGLIAVATVFLVGCPQTSDFPGWKPAGDEDRVIDRFARLVNARDAKAADLLGEEPVFDERPVSEEVADARQTDFYLRSEELKVLAIRRGEPDREGRMKEAAGRYTLVTRVQGSTPPLRVRNDKGEVESPSRLFMINPDLLVEVVDGKVRGVRPELHRD